MLSKGHTMHAIPYSYQALRRQFYIRHKIYSIHLPKTCVNAQKLVSLVFPSSKTPISTPNMDIYFVQLKIWPFYTPYASHTKPKIGHRTQKLHISGKNKPEESIQRHQQPLFRYMTIVARNTDFDFYGINARPRSGRGMAQFWYNLMCKCPETCFIVFPVLDNPYLGT
jgi:hypothetical protein